jgi:hypothetical protein
MTGSITSDRTYRLIFRALAIGAFVLLLALARDLSFRADDWDGIANRSLVDPVSLLRPYNDQFVLVTMAIYRLEFAIIGLRSYLPYVAVVLLAHVFTSAALGRLVTTISGPFAGLVASVVMLFLATGYEVLSLGLAIGLVGAPGLGLWAIDSVLRGRHPLHVVLPLLLAVACHPIGAVFLVMATALALRRGRAYLPGLAIVWVVLVAWFVVFDLPMLAQRGSSMGQNLIGIPLFIGGGIAAAAGSLFGVSALPGAVVLGCLMLLAWRLRSAPAQPDVVLAAFIGLIGFYAMIAVSRGEFGIAGLEWSRYRYNAVPIAILAVAAWVGRPRALSEPRSRAEALLVGLALVSIVANLRWYVLAREQLLAESNQTRAAVAVALWATDLQTWDQQLFLPSPARVRDLAAEAGSPTRDRLVPGVTTPIPPEDAQAACGQYLRDSGRIPDCVQAVVAS